MAVDAPGPVPAAAPAVEGGPGSQAADQEDVASPRAASGPPAGDSGGGSKLPQRAPRAATPPPAASRDHGSKACASGGGEPVPSAGLPARAGSGDDQAANRLYLFLAVAMVFGGCMGNVVAMEYILKGDPQAGNLLTFTEVLFALFQCVASRYSPQSPFRFRLLPVAPLGSHAKFTVLWSSMSILANYAFGYKISVTIFTLVRSCNIIASVVVGRLAFGERYSWKQLLCTGAVSVGIFLASMGEARAIQGAACHDCADAPPRSPGDAAAPAPAGDLGVWLVGIAMLAVVQLIQGVLGHTQAGFYKAYAHLAPRSELSDEYLFTSQLVALMPLFCMRAEIGAALWRALETPAAFLGAPSRVVWLAANSATNLICLKGVFRASSVVSPLTLTLILSVRKFLSVLLSIFWFSNPWTSWHSVAAVLIFGGAFAYSQAPLAVDEPKKKS